MNNISSIRAWTVFVQRISPKEKTLIQHFINYPFELYANAQPYHFELLTEESLSGYIQEIIDKIDILYKECLDRFSQAKNKTAHVDKALEALRLQEASMKEYEDEWPEIKEILNKEMMAPFYEKVESTLCDLFDFSDCFFKNEEIKKNIFFRLRQIKLNLATITKSHLNSPEGEPMFIPTLDEFTPIEEVGLETKALIKWMGSSPITELPIKETPAEEYAHTIRSLKNRLTKNYLLEHDRMEFRALDALIDTPFSSKAPKPHFEWLECALPNFYEPYKDFILDFREKRLQIHSTPVHRQKIKNSPPLHDQKSKNNLLSRLKAAASSIMDWINQEDEET